ncbi:hypothetical protein GCM10007082_07240 [Oceanisphaera arctica]|nr:hypothetical protein GCM10007082_07240 [Oceanisphaera arctica]
MTTHQRTLEGNPDNKVKMIWCLGIGGIAMAVFFTGGSIDTIKALCGVAGFPMIFIYAILMKSFFNWVKRDYPQLSNPAFI